LRSGMVLGFMSTGTLCLSSYNLNNVLNAKRLVAGRQYLPQAGSCAFHFTTNQTEREKNLWASSLPCKCLRAYSLRSKQTPAATKILYLAAKLDTSVTICPVQFPPLRTRHQAGLSIQPSTNLNPLNAPGLKTQTSKLAVRQSAPKASCTAEAFIDITGVDTVISSIHWATVSLWVPFCSPERRHAT
jgi:hypothetical protein